MLYSTTDKDVIPSLVRFSADVPPAIAKNPLTSSPRGSAFSNVFSRKKLFPGSQIRHASSGGPRVSSRCPAVLPNVGTARKHRPYDIHIATTRIRAIQCTLSRIGRKFKIHYQSRTKKTKFGVRPYGWFQCWRGYCDSKAVSDCVCRVSGCPPSYGVTGICYYAREPRLRWAFSSWKPSENHTS